MSLIWRIWRQCRQLPRRVGLHRPQALRAGCKRHARQGSIIGRWCPTVSCVPAAAAAVGEHSRYSITTRRTPEISTIQTDRQCRGGQQIAQRFVAGTARSTIDPRLLTILSHVYDHLVTALELLSGYRFNADHQQPFSRHRCRHSNFRRAARDLRPLCTPWMRRNGVGFYRGWDSSIGRRPAPSYRWIDNSRSNPILDKQPPRGWSTGSWKVSRATCVARTADRALHFKCKRRMVLHLKCKQHRVSRTRPAVPRLNSSEIRASRAFEHAHGSASQGPNPCTKNPHGARSLDLPTL